MPEPVPALVAVAHGSRDPRSAATIGELADQVRRRRPDVDVRVGFLDLSAPRLPGVLAGVAVDGHRRAVVVPLLLGDAFHARFDVPGAVSDAARRHPRLHIDTADVLGGDPGAETAALHRLHTALCAPTAPAPGPPHPGPACRTRPGGCGTPTGGAATDRGVRGAAGPYSRRGDQCAGCRLRDPGLGVVLASVGSSRASANRAVAERVARWRERFGWAAASAAYVTAAEPTPAQAIQAVRDAGADRVAVVPWVLAPGRLPDRIDAAGAEGGAVVARPIGPHPDLAATVLRRWAAATVRPATGIRQVS